MDAVAVMEMRMDGGRPAPSSGWFVQERSTKPMKETSAAVGSGNVYVNKAAAEAGAANKAAEASKTKLEGAKKRTKTMRVKQAYIDLLLKQYPFRALPFDPKELEKNTKDPVRREMLRELFAPVVATVKEARDKDEAIIKQYFAQGYAEEEVEVDDEEAEA